MRKKYMSTEFQKNDISIETVIVEILEKISGTKTVKNSKTLSNVQAQRAPPVYALLGNVTRILRKAI